MLLSVSRGAPYTCLRCQLRQAIFPSRRRCIDRIHPNAARSFSVTQRRRDHEDEEVIEPPRQRDERSIVYHHPLGRIVGAPGRRQRQGSQTLKIDAMKKPFEVIVMHDVREPEEKRVSPRNMQNGATMSAAQIQSAIAKEGEDPTQEEVNESISALRPDSSILDEEQYKALAKTLTDGFTTEQLHNFFTQSLNLSAIEGDTVHLLQQQPSKLQTRYLQTQWRPGRTRIDKRLPLGAVVKKNEKANKPKLVDQTLRLTWRLAIHAEEQKVGELEMHLKDWELAYLFDLQYIESGNFRTMYESFVESPYLLRACDIRPYRPHGYVRITGRRRDAEELAQNIANRLPDLVRLSVKLGTFDSLLGTPGWPKTYETLFRKEDIQLIQTRTTTVIDQPRPGTVHVYGATEDRTHQARRLLVSLLELPAPSSTTSVSSAAGMQNKAVPLPYPQGSTLHLRHRKHQLTRLTFPTARTVDGEDQPSQSSKAANDVSSFVSSDSAAVFRQLVNTPTKDFSGSDPQRQTYWDASGPMTNLWKVQLCTILSEVKANKKGPKRKKKAGPTAGLDDLTVVDPQTRGLETLLSFFKPRLYESDQQHLRMRSDNFLVARFAPSPFTDRGVQAMSDLPPVELMYRTYTSENGTPGFWLVGAQACLEQQDVRVQLPSEVNDLQFQRSTNLRARGTPLKQDADVAAFTQTLRESLRSSKHGSLVGEPQIRIALPGSLNRRKGKKGVEAGESPTPVPYLFMGFEQRQTNEYIPISTNELPQKMGPGMKDILTSVARNHLCLQLKEVAAGVVGGRRTEVWLRYSPPPGSTPIPMPGHEIAKNNEDGPEISAADGSVEGSEDEQADVAVLGDRGVPLTPSVDVTSQLVKTALGVTRLLTKIDAGEIQPMTYHRSEVEAADHQGEQTEVKVEGEIEEAVRVEEGNADEATDGDR